MGGGCRIWQPRPWVCSWGYLEGKTFNVYHLPEPAEGSIDELQHGQEGDEVGCNVGHETHGGGSSVASSFQDVLLFPAWKKTPMDSSGWTSPMPGQRSLHGCVHTTGSQPWATHSVHLCPKVPPWLPCTGRTHAAPLHCPSPHTHPLERRMLALPLNLDSSTSG